MLTVRLSSGDHAKRPPSGEAEAGDIAPRTDAPRVLIVEDEFLVAWHLQGMLLDLDLIVSGIAADPQGAIDRAIDLDPDLVLMDVNLGEGPDGVEVARRIRSHCSAAVVFVTAYTDAATVSRIRLAVPGAPVVAKPPSMHDLRAAIAEVLPPAAM